MKKFSGQIVMLSVVLCITFIMGITAQAAPMEENKQSAELSDLLDGELSEYGTEIKEWLSEELKEEGSDKQVEEVIDFIREKLESGELETEEDIFRFIREGEEKFDVRLTEKEKEKIMQLMQKIEELGLNPESFLQQVQDLYEQLAEELLADAKDAVKKSVENSVAGFFKDMGNRVKEFFANIFS